MKKKSRILLKKNANIGIVNRGEPAVRFIRAVKEYNILYGTSLRTVVFYLPMDQEALYVKEADFARLLVSFRNANSTGSAVYLDHELILQALASTNCQAVYLGWGFLAEDALFVELLEKNGIVSISPSSKSMALLGDKIAAKKLAEDVKVPILPWSGGPVTELKIAKTYAKTIGYPLILKASNAGGGRGIRMVSKPEDLETQYLSAVEETERITGNRIIFMEHFVSKARHLEVQVLADFHGIINTFGVRDCSVQRKNQKLIEETPPPGLQTAQIKEMEAAAVRLIKAADYENAGTVEFIYDLEQKKFYFMEVNTRLQVEHPITEEYYGIDIVQQQIKISFGEKIDIKSKARGHVIEARLNAEDADRNFAPSPGRVTLFKAPAGPGIRIDSGIEEGSLIPSEFDSMVAKIIASGNTRKEAAAHLRRALEELKIKVEGGTTNRAFLLGILENPEYEAGGVSTGFVEGLLQQEIQPIQRDNWDIALVVTAIKQYIERYQDELGAFKRKFTRISPPRDITQAKGSEITIKHQGHTYSFWIKSVGNNIFHIEIDGITIVAQYLWRGEEAVLLHEKHRSRIQMGLRGDVLQCEVDGIPYMIDVESQGVVRAPSPAIVISILVNKGDKVDEGDPLVTLEAMKMEMIVAASAPGFVKSILIRDGEQIAAGQPLVELESSSDENNIPNDNQVPYISFDKLALPDETTSKYASLSRWEMYRREFLGIFLGYDYDNPEELFQKLTAYAEEHIGFHQKLTNLCVTVMEIYVAVENLYVSEKLQTENMARPLDFQELLMHFFWRMKDHGKGLPDEFIDRLENAIRWYPWADIDNHEGCTRALFRMYKSHANLALKQKLLFKILFTLVDLSQHVSDAIPVKQLADVLGGIVNLSQKKKSTLSDAALHARYYLIDKILIVQSREEQRQKITELLKLIMNTKKKNLSSRKKLTSDVLDAGHHIVFDLVSLGTGNSEPKRRLALELVSKRFNRDRTFNEAKIVHLNDNLLYNMISSQADEVFNTQVLIVKEENFARDIALLKNFLNNEITKSENQSNLELILLIKADKNEAETQLCETFLKEKMPVKWCSVGLFFADGSYAYHLYRYDEKNYWKEDVRCRFLSPLMCRELRMQRLEKFDLNLLYHGESVFLFQARSVSNKKDERLFALVEAPEAKVKFTSKNRVQRIVSFENAFMEAIHAMRAEQAKRKRRLYWNRIIVHFRSMLTINLSQMKDYALMLAPRTSGLGLEKVVIYSRSVAASTSHELEYLFENLSGSLFTMRFRPPSNKPLEAMDDYVARVVRARQRKAIYPYQIIKMITRQEAGNEDFPVGSFQEYGITINEDDNSQSYQPVLTDDEQIIEKNIVFGIISNSLENYPFNIERVIILGDPTIDMGALGETECRSIIAALDLAEEKMIPIEWIPISSGARIDMNSGTENLDWTALTLKRIIEFTQNGNEINLIVPGINVGAQSYWNSEATMLMHTKGLLIMTDKGTMQLTGKKALDFSGSVSAEDNISIGGVEKIMGPNGEAQVRAADIPQAYHFLFDHYSFTYAAPNELFPPRLATSDSYERNVCEMSYVDKLGQGFNTIGDIFDINKNPERKKPFDMRQILAAVIDQDLGFFERWKMMQDAETAIVWESRIGGYAVGLIGIESRPLNRLGAIPNDGPEAWSGGTLFPMSSKKVARAINAFSNKLPTVILANLSGFDGSPESLRNCQLEFGAEIGRAVVNYKGPIIFVVIARYHGGAYVVFSQQLNPNLKAIALENTYASVIGGAPAAAVVFQGQVYKNTYADTRITDAVSKLNNKKIKQQDFDLLFQTVFTEKQNEIAANFDKIHSVERAKKVGSIQDIIPPNNLRPYLINTIEELINL